MEVNGEDVEADIKPDIAKLNKELNISMENDESLSNHTDPEHIPELKKEMFNNEEMDEISETESMNENETDLMDNPSGEEDVDFDFDDDENTTESKSHGENIQEFARKIRSKTIPFEGKYKCTMCPLVSKYRNRVALHIKRTHYCDFCIDFYPKEELPDHLRSHDEKDKTHQCRFCNDEFHSALKLHSHDCSFSKRANLFYHCKICKAMFSSRDSLQSHIRSHSPESFESEWHKQVCQLCGYVFLGRQTLVRHMAKRDCQHCGMVAVSSCQYQKHLLSNHNSGAYRCHKCDVQMMSQHSFVDHINERLCSGCNEMIEPDCEYVKHIKLCKNGIQPDEDLQEFSCFKCTVILKDTYIYDLHVRDHIQNPLKNVCRDCGQNFQQNYDYAIHMSRRTCPQCNAKFQPYCAWRNHVCVKIDPPTVSCPKCHIVFSKASSYRKHCKTLRCHICPKLCFDSVCEMNKHFDEEHGGVVKPLELYEDDSSMTLRSTSTPVKPSPYMIDHMDDEFDDTKDESSFDQDPDHDGKLDNSLTYKECPKCDNYRGPMTYSKLRRHLQGSKCSICMMHVSPCCQINTHYVQCAYALAPTEENKPLLEKTANDPVDCPLCKMKLKALSGLKSHLRMVPSPCKECKEVFKTPCVLRLHQKETLHCQRDCVCPVCNKGFQYSRDLKKHLLIHSGERPYDCLLCGNTYKNPGHLSYHLKVQHGGARPYKCKYCGRGFGAQSGCNKHERRHETETDHKCLNCGMSFVAAHSLTKHITTRVCEQEGKQFIEQELPKKEPKKRIRKYIPKAQRKAMAEEKAKKEKQAESTEQIQKGLAMLQQCLAINMGQNMAVQPGSLPSLPSGSMPTNSASKISPDSLPKIPPEVLAKLPPGTLPALPPGWPMMMPYGMVPGMASEAVTAAAAAANAALAAAMSSKGSKKRKETIESDDDEVDDDDDYYDEMDEEEEDREVEVNYAKKRKFSPNSDAMPSNSNQSDSQIPNSQQDNDSQSSSSTIIQDDNHLRFTIKTEPNDSQAYESSLDTSSKIPHKATDHHRFSIKNEPCDNVNNIEENPPKEINNANADISNTTPKDLDEVKKVKPLVIKIERD